MGSSCFLHSPSYNCLFSTSSPPCTSQSVLLFCCPRKAHNQKIKKKRTVLVSMHQENSVDISFVGRRAVVFLGISVLPLLNLRAGALESLAAEDSEIRTQGQEQRAEQPLQGNESQNPALSLLNGLGVVGSGLLGALYALARKEKAASDTTIESMRNELKEKDAKIVSMERMHKSELLNEKEIRSKELKRAREEQQSLVNQLDLANGTVTRLGQELQKEKKHVGKLELEIDSLRSELCNLRNDKKELEEKLKEKLSSLELLQEKIDLLSLEIKDKELNLQRLGTTLTEKEIELNNLSSNYQQSQEHITGLTSEINKLKDEVFEQEKELELKNAAVDNLNKKLSSLVAERDESNRKLSFIQKEYSDFKSSSEKKVASDAKLLSEREVKLHQIEEQLKMSLDEMSRNNVIIADLTQEKNHLKKMLDAELENVKSLEQELGTTQNNLEKSRYNASELAKELQLSKTSCSKLEAELSNVRADSAEESERLHRNIDEAKRGAEMLAADLTSAKELLKKTNEEMQIITHELAAVADNRDSLKKELLDIYKKAESAAHDLEEERKIVAILNKELKALETQILKEKDARKALEADLEEATKSLDEMNQNTMLLSRDLDLTNSRISSLEDEKEALYKSLTDQKQNSQEAQENLEDAHNLIMRLGKEKETLEKRAKKLEDELSSAKGEILRARSQISSSQAPINNQHPEQEVRKKTAVPVKRTTRRRKVISKQDDS